MLVVQNAEHEDLGLLAAPFQALGIDATLVRAFAGERVPAALDADALVVMGGPPHVHDLATGPWMADVMRLIRHAHGRAPVLGVCLGAQLVAHALGGRAMPGAAGPEVGFEPLSLTGAGRADPLLSAFEGASVLQLHSDTYTLPPGAVRLASSRMYEEQAFRLGRATYALQFHPDIAPDALPFVEPDEPALVAEARRRAGEREACAEALARAFAKLG
jgi:GMP synthase-like glutamine amidotransferase